jgi:hypothetical protein
VITQALKDSLLAGLASDEEPQPERGASADISS